MTGTSPAENIPVHDAFKLWKTAHDHVINAIDEYANACSTLESACSRARLSFSEDNNDFDATLLTVEIELPRLEAQKRVLANGISSLKKARNQSYTLVPINILPQSLLLSIFSMLVDSEHTNQVHLSKDFIRPHPALAISCVSTGWRSLTFDSPSLWSSIFLHPGDQGDLPTQLSLVRASNALLDVQVSFPRDYTLDWIPLLHPRFDQIRSLNLVLPNMDLLRAIFTIWPLDSLAPSLKKIAIKIIQTTYDARIVVPVVLPVGGHELFLQNVTSFSLHGGYFDWNSAAFQGLEHLQLVGLVGAPSPTLAQIAGILRASPGLRTLGFGDIRMQPDEYSDTLPVYFEHLRKLSLMSLVESDLCRLLPLISPGPQPLALHMNYELIPGAAAEAYIELLRRSNVESIYFHTRISRNTMSDVFSSLPRLRFLYLTRNKYLSNILNALAAPLPASALTEENELPVSTGVPCPLLHTIHMHECKFKIDKLSGNPITNQPILTIKFQLCDPPNLVDVFSQHLVGLVSGQVFLEELESIKPINDAPFYGLNRTNAFAIARHFRDGNAWRVLLGEIPPSG
ncbi:hypothetical protein FRC12_013228 [Ceratobasidium sp. 428]|nr:hypothetical protein FRC12_013228 [Ceratobasidium sp. 428]